MIQQTIIPHSGANEHTFRNYLVGDNGDLVRQLQQSVVGSSKSRMLYIWGEHGSGKTHLLQSCCAFAQETNRPFQYLSMENSQALVKIIEEIRPSSFVGLDNLHLVETDTELEIKLLSLYERVISNEGNVVAAGLVPLNQIKLRLADLVSRLSSGGSYRILPLSESSKREALMARAQLRGFSLDISVLDFIMTHYSRDTTALFTLLDKIDSASLSHHRKVTIPFVRGLLSDE